jgi:predicted RNA-binding Zn-ribbon protein involved in translation (DUF1610 family)
MQFYWPLHIGWLPYLGICYELNRRLHTDWTWLAVLPYLVAICFLNHPLVNFRCPRCGERFYRVDSLRNGLNPFQKKCRNCGLRKWQCE